MSDKKSNANGVYPQEAVKSDIVKNEEFIGEHLETLREFAERGDASVMYLLGCYYDGEVCEGGGNDPDEAVKWYKRCLVWGTLMR